jgi:hypothetical protein
MGLARQATRLPLTALSLGLEAWERSRGLREVAVRRGGEVLQIAAHTPLGRFLPRLVIDDGADEEAARITAAVQAERATDASGRPEPASPPVPTAAKEVGAPGAVAAEVEQIVEEVTERADLAEPESRDELPIPDFDNISLGSLRARLRALDVEQLVVLREWEQAHAHRLPVLTALDNRIAKLGAATYPTGAEGGAKAGAGADGGAAARAEQAAEDEGGTLRV